VASHGTAPRGLGAAGRRFWRQIAADFELSPVDAVVMAEVCQTLDRLSLLADVVAVQGVLAESSQGVRAHPALTEERAQRELLVKLLAVLGLELGAVEDAPAGPGRRSGGRAVRGLYQIGGAA
jgi:phage terminase small subunit